VYLITRNIQRDEHDLTDGRAKVSVAAVGRAFNGNSALSVHNGVVVDKDVSGAGCPTINAHGFFSR
jgi:hypothetical protein